MPQTHLYGRDIGDVIRFFYDNWILGDKYVDLTRQYRRFTVAEEFANVKKRSKDGKSFKHALMIDRYDNGQDDSLFNPDSLDRQNLGQEGSSYWYMYKNGWIADRREPGYPKKGSAQQIVDHFQMQRTNMMNEFFRRQEQYKWTLADAPNDGSEGAIKPNSIPYYIVQSATAAIGQNGGHPSGYSDVSGLSRTTYPVLKNWTGTYTSVSQPDFIEQLSEMMDMLHWEAPNPNAKEEEPMMDYVIESHYAPFQENQLLAIGSNQNLGADTGAPQYRGKVRADSTLFRGVAWTWIDAISKATLRDGSVNPAYDANQPVYLRDKSTWELIGDDEFFLLESPPEKQLNPHNAYANHFDHIYNRICINPSANGVLRRA